LKARERACDDPSLCKHVVDVSKIIVASSGKGRVFYWLVAETGQRAGEIAGQRTKGHEFSRLPAFQCALQDALRVPLKTIQERLGHALTGSFTLDVYGGQPEWERNLEAAQQICAELEKTAKIAMTNVEREAQLVVPNGLSPFKKKGSGATIS
jgi:hypothetical protein